MILNEPPDTPIPEANEPKERLAHPFRTLRELVDYASGKSLAAPVTELRLDASEAAEILFRSFQVELDPEPTLLTVAAGMSRH